MQTELGFPIEEIKGLAGFLAYGTIGGGIIALNYFPIVSKNKYLKYITIGSGITLIGIGAIKYISQVTKEQRSVIPNPDDDFPIAITNPSPNDTWSTLLWHKITGNIQNPYNTLWRMWLGCTVFIEGRGYIDLPLMNIFLEPKAISEINWWLKVKGWQTGNAQVKISAWDVPPSEECEATGTCHRVGDSGWIPFKFEWIG